MHVFPAGNQRRQFFSQNRFSLRLYLNVDPAMFLQARAQVGRQAFDRVVLLDNLVHKSCFRMGSATDHRNVLRGSKASRTASPMKINSDSMTATVKKPVSPSHGAWRLALPCDSISPSDGDPGGSPKPRKSSAVNSITAPDMMNGSIVIVATMAFGRRWRNMITALETPSARAAWMYSKLRPRRNSARTRPTSDTQENNSRMPSSTKNPGTSTEEMISSR